MSLFLLKYLSFSMKPCLQVNKLHCGSVITFYDNSASADATVAVDVCLTALILAKVDTR